MCGIYAGRDPLRKGSFAVREDPVLCGSVECLREPHTHGSDHPLPSTASTPIAATAPFSTKHLLTMHNPLPASLVAFVRLDRMTDHELALQQRRADKAGTALWDLVRGDSPLDPLHELVSLGALRSVLQARGGDNNLSLVECCVCGL